MILFTNAAYYSFYPLYLTEVVGFAPRWVGLIASLGVVLELGYLILFDRFRNHLSLPKILAVGALACALRLAILAYLPSPFWAIVLQLSHGLTVLGAFIVPAMYLNTLAGDTFRSSVQGLYVMVVPGAFSILGNVVAGQLATRGLRMLFEVNLWIAIAGAGLIALAFQMERRARLSTPGV